MVYLDNAATTQKPKQVLATIEAYLRDNANVHRGVHTLAKAGDSSEAEKGSSLFYRMQLLAKSLHEEPRRVSIGSLSLRLKGCNLVMKVLISIAEHHSNVIPWREACRKTGAKLVYVFI